MEILVEVKILKKDFPEKEIPRGAKDIFERFDKFRQYNNTLEKMVDLYNYLRLQTIPEEFKLIEDEIAEIDNDLQPAENTLTWHATEIKDYVNGLRRKVEKLNERVKKSKVNLVKIEELINKWAESPMYTRKGHGVEPLFNLEEMETFKAERYKNISACNQEIELLLAESADQFLIGKKLKVTSRRWRSYLRHVDKIIYGSLLLTIASSIGYLLDQTDINKEQRYRKIKTNLTNFMDSYIFPYRNLIFLFLRTLLRYLTSSWIYSTRM